MTIEKGYSTGSRLLHWSMAAIIISMLFLGLSMVQSLATWQPDAVDLHKSFGVVALILVIVRLINRAFSAQVALPTDLPVWQKRIAHLSHIGLYSAMILMPISGWLMQSADGRNVAFFGWFSLPHIIEANIKSYALFREIHGLIAWLFLALILMHVSAALYHALIKQDGVLSSMLYGKK